MIEQLRNIIEYQLKFMNHSYFVEVYCNDAVG